MDIRKFFSPRGASAGIEKKKETSDVKSIASSDSKDKGKVSCTSKSEKKDKDKVSNSSKVEKTDKDKVSNLSKDEKTDKDKVSNSSKVEKTDKDKVSNSSKVEKTNKDKVSNSSKVEKTDKDKVSNSSRSERTDSSKRVEKIESNEESNVKKDAGHKSSMDKKRSNNKIEKSKRSNNSFEEEDEEVILIDESLPDTVWKGSKSKGKKEEKVKKESKDSKENKKEKRGRIKEENDDENMMVKDKRKRRHISVDQNGNEEFDEKTSKSRKKKKQVLSSEDELEADEVVSRPKRKGKKSNLIVDSESEEEPLPEKEGKKKRKKKNPIVFVDDSDQDNQPPKKTTLDKFFHTASPKSTIAIEDKKKNAPVKEEKKQPVSLADFFGAGSVHRVERKIPVPKRKLEEIEMHDDDDFEKTLQMLDEELPPKKSRVETPPLREEEKKTESPKRSTPASKLSTKVKSFIADTPDASRKAINDILVPDTPICRKEDLLTKKSPSKPSPDKPRAKVSPAKMEVSSQFSKKSTPKPSAITSPVKMEVTVKKVSPVKVETPKGKRFSPNKSGAEATPTSEKKMAFRSYLQREGPRALGSKEIPEGAENCLEGLTFVITGVLESLERDDAKRLVERYGGKVTGSVSKKTNYLVVGRDSGQSKLDKAKSLGTRQIDEDGLLDLIRTKPGKKSKYEIQAEATIKKENSFTKVESKIPLETFKKEAPAKKDTASGTISQTMSSLEASTSAPSSHSESLLWVDKYKPTSLKQIIGQQGDKSNAKKLYNWLTKWHENQAAGVKPQARFFGGGRDDGSGFKVALLSGPPGIGKTTTATLVCQEAGFSYVELNASDTRSKKSLQEVVSQALTNTTLIDYMGAGSSATHGHKHCMVMDEVDGMAGSEDRGGIQELVQLIKTTKIPIICMCNDRNHPKMRTLANYCFDLRFQRPRVEQIKSAMMTLAFKEDLKIPPPALNEIILAANQDIRQVIHNLSMWTAGEKSLSFDQAKKDSDKAKKDFKLSPFDVCRKVFIGGEETAKMTIHDKSDLFFHDYSIAPLFVQENYINVIPFAARGDQKRHLSLLARTADSICAGDLVEKCIRSKGTWSLLPMEAMYASVIPGEYMRGSFPQMVTFPSWLGKNSSTGKNERILQELRTHMRLQTSGDKRSLNMDYLPFLRKALTEPLVQKEVDGIPEVISLMDTYDIIREDFDNIIEVTKWPNSSDPMSKLNTKTKAAFTRTYNKEVHMTPYSTGNLTKKKRGRGGGTEVEEDLLNLDEEGVEIDTLVESDKEEEDLEADTMIKKKSKSGGKDKTETVGDKGGKGQGKGKGQGNGKRR